MLRKLCAVTFATMTLVGCTATPASVSAEETCAQIGDVITILVNADAALLEGRSDQQEHDGAVSLAARVLARAQAEPGTDLSAAVDALKALAPATPINIRSDPFDSTSAAWNEGVIAVSDACLAAGTELRASKWTGG